jgi:putative FmdB family regulatory protein
MPIYEYHCPDCEETFEAFVRKSRETEELRCPECGSAAIERLISSFATSIPARARSASCGSSRFR